MAMSNPLDNGSEEHPESVQAITIDDLKNFYAANFSPSIASFHIAGNISKGRML